MTEIYVVFGVCGEYSDRSEWMVCAYADKAMAETHATLANLWSKKHGDDWYRTHYTQREKCPFDDGYSADYTGGADYSVASVPVLSSVPHLDLAG